MSDIDRTNIDAVYWANKAAKVLRLSADDEDTLMGWFANYRFAVSDPLDARIAALEGHIVNLETERDGYRQAK